MTVNYFQLYGVEPFEALGTPLATDYGGGAKVTNDNFLITLWNVTAFSGALPSAGDRIKPVWQTESGAEQVINLWGPGYTKNTFASRLSTRFQLQGLNTAPGSYILAVLRSVQDLQLQAYPPAVLNPSSPIGIFFDLDNNPMWVAAMDVELHQPIGTPVSGAPISDVPVNLLGLGMLPLLKTNGADGVFPEFYDASSTAALLEYVNTIKRGGPVYLGAVIGPTVGHDTLDVILRWPHSGGRG